MASRGVLAGITMARSSVWQDKAVAAKIIAVARGRALARRTAAIAHAQQLVRRGDPLPAAKL
jgi:hypothetical protein